MICPNLFYFGWFFDFCKTDHLGVREEAIALPPMYKTHLENGKEILDFFFVTTFLSTMASPEKKMANLHLNKWSPKHGFNFLGKIIGCLCV